MWHLFVPSHGKGPCNTDGGITNLQTARASVQCSYDKQILTPTDFHEFAQENIHEIKYFYVSHIIKLQHGESFRVSGSCVALSTSQALIIPHTM